MCGADLEEGGGFCAVDLPVVKLLENVLEKGAGQTFGQLFFSQFRMASAGPLVEGWFPQPKYFSPFELPPFSFCSRPDTQLFQ